MDLMNQVDRNLALDRHFLVTNVSIILYVQAVCVFFWSSSASNDQKINKGRFMFLKEVKEKLTMLLF